MYDCKLPEATQAEVLDRPDYSSLIRGAGREEALRDLRTSTAIETDESWLFSVPCTAVTTFRPLGEAKAGTHHLFFGEFYGD